MKVILFTVCIMVGGVPVQKHSFKVQGMTCQEIMSNELIQLSWLEDAFKNKQDVRIYCE